MKAKQLTQVLNLKSPLLTTQTGARCLVLSLAEGQVARRVGGDYKAHMSRAHGEPLHCPDEKQDYLNKNN